MKKNEQWNTFFAIEKNISYDTHLQNTKELSQLSLAKSARKHRQCLSFGALVRKQFKFLAWKIWLLQGMVLAFLYTLFLSLYTTEVMKWSYRVMPRFLCCCSGVIVMSSIPLLRRSVRYRMMELEQSTRFSAAGNLASQLLFIGTGDLGMLMFLAFAVAKYDVTESVIFLSLIVPFLTTAVTCLMLLSRTPFFVFNKSVVRLCILTTLLMNYVIDQYRQFHSDGRITGWVLYSLCCLAILYHEYRKICKPMSFIG